MNLKKNNAKSICIKNKSHNIPAFISKCSTRNKNSAHKSNNRTFIPFIEPLTPKSPLQIVVSSVALCFSVLGRVPFSITSRILKPCALELAISVPRSGNYWPPRALPWQDLLSSDMDPLDHPAGQRCGLERKAK